MFSSVTFAYWEITRAANVTHTTTLNKYNNFSLAGNPLVCSKRLFFFLTAVSSKATALAALPRFSIIFDPPISFQRSATSPIGPADFVQPPAAREEPVSLSPIGEWDADCKRKRENRTDKCTPVPLLERSAYRCGPPANGRKSRKSVHPNEAA